MVIEAADFQKIKRLTTIGKMINVVIQKDNYLSFKCDAGVIYDSNLGFGELQSASNERCTCDEEDPEKIVTVYVKMMTGTVPRARVAVSIFVIAIVNVISAVNIYVIVLAKMMKRSFPLNITTYFNETCKASRTLHSNAILCSQYSEIPFKIEVTWGKAGLPLERYAYLLKTLSKYLKRKV